jgi:hypothetical protein
MFCRDFIGQISNYIRESVFAQPQVQYLGFVLSQNGITPSPEVNAVKQYPSPKSVKEVWAFLGLASFYRRLVPKLAEIAKLLTRLTRKDQEFKWGHQQQEAFQSMRDRLCTASVLAYPNFSQPFILSTDASKMALGATLSQAQDGLEKPLAYVSRLTKKAEKSYTTSELEMLALVWATKHFRCFWPYVFSQDGSRGSDILEKIRRSEYSLTAVEYQIIRVRF